MTTEHIDLYQREPPVGDPILILVAPSDVPNDVPTKMEIEQAVCCLCSGKAPGPSGIRSDQLKDWLRAAIREENLDTQAWLALVDLVQHVYQTGDFPQRLHGPWWFSSLSPMVEHKALVS